MRDQGDEQAREGPLLTSVQFWMLLVVYAICGFQDFFVQTHVVAFALDMGIGTVVAGYLLALMGVMGLLGVMASGYLADKLGPGRPTLLCFVMRIGIFLLVILNQDKLSVMIFALLYGFTFLMTAPLTVMFSGNIFGSTRLGRVSGTISGVHQVSGGMGALAGALSFDIWGSYDRAFLLMLALSIIATVGTLLVQGQGSQGRAAARDDLPLEALGSPPSGMPWRLDGMSSANRSPTALGSMGV